MSFGHRLRPVAMEVHRLHGAHHGAMASVKTRTPSSPSPSNSGLEFQTLPIKPGETELLRLRNQTNALSALSELVWNSLDADAKTVHLEWTENEMMGVESISVSDDGHGIAIDEKNMSAHPFMTLGDSDKHTVIHQSPNGRMLHGRFGKGRLRALALGGVITWSTVFAVNAKTRRHYIVKATVGEPSVEVSPSKVTKKPTGTHAQVALISEKGNTLEAKEVRQRFSQIFSEHLSNYPDISIYVQGEKLDPAALIRSQDDLGAYDTEFPSGDTLHWNLRCIQWNDRVSDAKGRLFLCDNNRMVIGEVELGLRGAEDATFYLDCEQAREWEDDGMISLRDDAQEILHEARRKAFQFLRRSFGQRAQSLTEELIDQRVYPYSSACKNAAEESERELFSKFALHIRQSVGSYEKMNLDNKRLLFKLLAELLHREPTAVADVLSSVLKMTHEDRKALSSLKGSL